MTIKDSPYYKEYEEGIREKAKETLAALRIAKGDDVPKLQGYLDALDFVLGLPDEMKAEKEEEGKDRKEIEEIYEE